MSTDSSARQPPGSAPQSALVGSQAAPAALTAQGRLDRLSRLDLSNLRVEDRGAPMHVAALLILEQLPTMGQEGRSGLAAVRGHVEVRLHVTPRLRQVLYQPPRGFGRPVWVDYPGFDIQQHVQARAIGVPGDDGALLRACAELNETPLDRSRPLWQIWLLTGLAGDRAALLIRLHHVIADGTAALEMLSALCGPDVGEPARALAWTPACAPGLRELAADRLGAARQALARLGRPRPAGAWLRRITRQSAVLARERRAPRLSLNVPVSGSRRQLATVRADLSCVRAGAHACSGTVNDAVLAAVAGGARALLGARAEVAPSMVLKASVAVSLRSSPGPQAGGNLVGVMIAPLPVGERDTGRRLAQIAAATTWRKANPAYEPSSRIILRWMVRRMARQRMVNLLVSNLHGPEEPLRFAGAQVLEMFQFGVVQGNVPVSVGALSYAGQLNLAIVADGAVRELDLFAAGMAETVRELGALTSPRRDSGG